MIDAVIVDVAMMGVAGDEDNVPVDLYSPVDKQKSP